VILPVSSKSAFATASARCDRLAGGTALGGPSWNDGAAKSAILDFVTRVTKQGGADFVLPAERVATFDNDGTICCEQPLQTQFFFLFDRVKELSAKDPALDERQPFKAVLEHDYCTRRSCRS
jgi:hypothetical protein